ncbi:hypothetical protein [Siminovitchia sp. FSL W7-1587]|uniref:hypothetical protein n=1 Tax=Siminovitchia sp. FSL W7-1587 TaxID=2954699 RepID=UPI0030CB99F3
MDKKPVIGLTQFIDFTVKQTMTAKINKVTEIKNQGEYHPARDHWKQLRERIRYCCENQLDFNVLDSLPEEVHERKANSYRKAVLSFKKFVKNKQISWFDPPKSHWNYSDQVVVRSTPELGLIIDDIPHLVKLFFKGNTEKITERNIKPILNLMLSSTREHQCPEGTVVSVLNIKKSRLFVEQSPSPKILKALKYEAITFRNIWDGETN